MTEQLNNNKPSKMLSFKIQDFCFCVSLFYHNFMSVQMFLSLFPRNVPLLVTQMDLENMKQGIFHILHIYQPLSGSTFVPMAHHVTASLKNIFISFVALSFSHTWFTKPHPCPLNWFCNTKGIYI